jgi:signal transduction histidine kinase
MNWSPTSRSTHQDVRTSAPDCLMRVSLTPDTEVRCSILDTGVGVDISLDERLGATEKPEQRLLEALSGALPGWDQGRGVGLPRVADVVRAHGGRLTVATHVLRARLGDEEILVSRDGFSVEGTVIDCTIPVG